MESPGDFELKRISSETVARAMERAERYRLLNEPRQAESICLDVLEVEPDHQRALVILILSITDQFNTDGGSGASAQRARSYLPRLETEYCRAYYAGIICEKRARAFLGRGMASAFAYDAFRDAMDWYEKAESLSDDDNDDAILRWNCCVRIMRHENLRPMPGESRELPLE